MYYLYSVYDFSCTNPGFIYRFCLPTVHPDLSLFPASSSVSCHLYSVYSSVLSIFRCVHMGARTWFQSAADHKMFTGNVLQFRPAASGHHIFFYCSYSCSGSCCSSPHHSSCIGWFLKTPAAFAPSLFWSKSKLRLHQPVFNPFSTSGPPLSQLTTPRRHI